MYSSRGVIKNNKVRQGLKFLLRKLNDLVTSLQVLVELAETGKTEVRNKVAAVFEELLRRKWNISRPMEQYIVNKIVNII